jgi:hypothetical protein
MLNQAFYPTLRDLIKVDALPPSLGFLQSALGPMLDNFFYDNLVYDKAPNGAAANYSLDVILKEKVVLLSIPGTEIALILNPPPISGPQTGTIFKVSLEYRWEILRFIRGMKLSSFSFSVRGFLDLIAGMLGITREEMVEELINVFIGDLANPPVGQDPLQDFVDDYNAKYTPPITSYTDLVDVVNQINANHDIFQIIIDDYLDDTFDKLKALITKWVGPLDEEGLKRLVIPYFYASIDELAFGIELPRSVFIPVDNAGVQLPGNSMIRVGAGSLSVDSQKGFLFDKNLVFSFTRSEILNSGFILMIDGMKLDFSEVTNIPEATADGRPEDFRGVYIQSATIDFPAFWQHNDTASTGRLNARNLLIGTGGVSGTISMEAKTAGNPSPLIEAKFGAGFSVSLDAFSLQFKQSAIVKSEILGTMKIPGFKDATGTSDAEIKIKVHIGQNGEFSVTATEADGIRIKIPNILDLIIKSASIGRKNGRFYFSVSGAIDFQDMGGSIGKLLPDKLEIQKLLIWDNGDIELEGGKIVLPRAISLKVGPVALSVTGIGLGSHEQTRNNSITNLPELRKYKYFMFDGGINVNPGGVDVSGKGIAFYYTTDNNSSLGRDLHFFVRIQSIAIDIVIPGNAKPENATLLLKGFLSMKEATPPAVGTEYAGGVDFTLPKLKMGGSAAMRLNPKIPAFLVDVSLEIATPILLGSTGLGIYGFRGLVGQRYVASKDAAGLNESDPWWMYYKAKVADTYKEGINIDKFSQEDGFSLGAGVSLATAPDSGKIFSSKLFFLLSLPEVFLLQGQGAILKERVGLDTTQDPPFFALLSITSTSIEAAFGINYKIPDDGADPGAIATVNALIEMGFFWGNAAGWYINIGKDQPTERRISVRLLKIVNAYFYMMLSSQGIRAGAGASYELKKKFGPLKAELSAYFDVAGKISFKPKQIGGSIALGGAVGLSIFGFGFRISVAASLAAEAPKPFNITGSLKVCIRVLKKDRCAHFEFSWTFNDSLDLQEFLLFNPGPSDHAKALNMQTEEGYAIYAATAAPTLTQLENFIIPADSYIDIEFVKGVLPSSQVVAQFGGNTMGAKYIDYIAPQRAKNDRVRHEYMLDSIRVQYWNGSAWADYQPYVAATNQALLPFFNSSLNLATLPKGYWQIQTPNLYNKLRVMATSPITYSSQGSGDLILEELNVTSETIFCDPVPAVRDCWDFTAYDPKLGYNIVGNPLLPNGKFFFKGKALMQIVGADGEVADMPHLSFPEAVRIPAEATFKAALVEPMTYVSLLLKAVCVDLVVTVHRRVELEEKGPGGLPLFTFDPVRSWTVPEGETQEIVYEDILNPVELITITPSACKPPRNGGGAAGDPRRTGDPKSGCLGCGKDAVPAKEAKGDTLRVDSGTTTVNPIDPRVPVDPELPVDPGTGLVCTDLTREAYLLQHYFDTLADNNLLTEGQFNYFPDWRWLMDGVFQYTSLYPAPADEKVTITHTRTQIDDHNLRWRVYDDRGFICDFTLELIQTRSIASLGWESIRKFTNIRIDPDRAVNGPNYNFLVDVEINGRQITLRGSSCYPIAECTGAPDTGPCIPTEEAPDLEAYLDLLARERMLVTFQPIEYYPHLYNGYGPVFVGSSLYPGPFGRDLVVTHTQTFYNETVLSWVVSDNQGFSCEFTLELVQPPVAINFSLISAMFNLRMDPANTVPGSNYAFLIDANYNGRIVTLRGTSCYPIATCGEGDACRICEPYRDMLKAIEVFLQRIAELDNFSTPQFPIWWREDDGYDGYFYNTLMYGKPGKRNPIDYVLQSYTGEWLAFDIMDSRGYRCRWNLYAPDKQQIDWKQVVKIYNVEADFSAGTYGPIYAFTATVELSNGEVLQITGSSCNIVGQCRKDCAGYLYQICVMGYEGSAWNQQIGSLPTAVSQVQTMINAFNGTVQPVWRFNTYFRIEVTTDDRLYRESGTSLLTNYAKTHYFAFRTAGPPGHFHQYQNAANVTTTRPDYAALEAADREDEYKQRLLLHYLDFPKCYPNADGQLLNSKPLFYKDPKLGLYFTKAYVYQFYNDWNALSGLPAVNSKLMAVIKDPAPDPLAPLMPDVLATWEVNALPNISTDVTILNNMMDNTQPGDCTPSYTITPHAMYPAFKLPELLPLKLYTAIFNAHFKKGTDPTPIVREVHRYGFQTSRYPDFKAQIQSWKLKVDTGGAVLKGAIFVEERPWVAADLTLAAQVLHPADTALPKGDPLRQTFGHKFNRLIEGVLKLESLHPAATMEFNVIRQQGTGRTLGILIKNPEPLNDPKTPIPVPVTPSPIHPVRLSVNGGPVTAYQALYSKDFSQVFIYKGDLSLNIPAGASLAFHFDYVLFDGVAYTVAASESVTITLP